MIIGINLISSAELTEDSFRTLLASVGASMGQPDLAASGKMYDGSSNLWIHLTDAEGNGYDGEVAEAISQLLNARPHTFIQIEFDDGETSVPNLMKIVSEIAQIIPIVFDNGVGRYFGPNEIDALVSSGQF